MASIDRQLGRHEQAKRCVQNSREEYENLVGDFPDNRLYRHGLADLCLMLESESGLRQAVDLYQQLAAEDPALYRSHLAQAHYRLGYYLVFDGTSRGDQAYHHFRTALTIQEELARTGRDNSLDLAATCNSLGILYRKGLSPREAEALHRKALEHCERPSIRSSRQDCRSERARGHNHLAAALAAQNRRDEALPHALEACALLKQLNDEFPLAGQPVELAGTYYGLGRLLQQAGRHTEAEEAYQRALIQSERVLKEFPHRTDGERPLILTLVPLIRYRIADDPPAAERYFQRLCTIAPRENQDLNNLAWFLVTLPGERFQNPRRALELIEPAVQKDPKNGAIRNTLGLIRYRLGDFPGAIADLEESRRLMKGFHDSFNTFFLALAHGRLGHHEQARHWYRQAVEWMDKNLPNDEELLRFRAEAKEAIDGG
jgi:tetratricopeptide (TPR) repeat protein